MLLVVFAVAIILVFVGLFLGVNRQEWQEPIRVIVPLSSGTHCDLKNISDTLLIANCTQKEVVGSDTL